MYGDYRDGKLIVNRGYQRKLVWTLDEKRKLIDSILHAYPVPLVLLAELANDDRPRGRFVSQHAGTTRALEEGRNDFRRETLRIGRKGLVQPEAGQFPVPRRAVFTRRHLLHPPVGGSRPIHGRYTRQRCDIPESFPFH